VVWPYSGTKSPCVAISTCERDGTPTTKTTFTLDDALAERARQLGINISAAARDGVAAAVRAADRAAYERRPERRDPFWDEAEGWTEG
jgi:post-segregation antitoxin (ccd killing protein)